MKRVIFVLLVLAGCHYPSYERGEVLGADEFVMDSYALQETEGEKRAGFVSVAGAVMKRGVVPIARECAALHDVLMQAGGVKTVSDRQRIFVFRQALDEPRVYALSWEHLVRLPKTSLLVMPGDIVFVGTKPLFEWVGYE